MQVLQIVWTFFLDASIFVSKKLVFVCWCVISLYNITHSILIPLCGWGVNMAVSHFYVSDKLECMVLLFVFGKRQGCPRTWPECDATGGWAHKRYVVFLFLYRSIYSHSYVAHCVLSNNPVIINDSWGWIFLNTYSSPFLFGGHRASETFLTHVAFVSA